MEPIEVLNARLADYYGKTVDTNEPIFRVVWANDQTEMRLTDTLDSGIQLTVPTIQRVRKYSYLKDLYVLERLVEVPDFQQRELGGLKVSYEPVWAFKDSQNNPVAPAWGPIEFVIDCLYAALGKTSLVKYTNPDDAEGAKEERVDKLIEELFGDESGLYGKTTTGAHEGVVVPSNYGDNK